MGCKLSVPSVSPIMTLRGNRQDNLGIWRVFHPRTGHWYCCKYQNLFGLTLWVPAHTICSGMDSNHADREEKAEGEPGFTCSSCSHYVRDCPSCGQELPSLQTVRLFGSSHFKHYSWLADPWAFMPSQPWRPHQSETSHQITIKFDSLFVLNVTLWVKRIGKEEIEWTKKVQIKNNRQMEWIALNRQRDITTKTWIA